MNSVNSVPSSCDIVSESYGPGYLQRGSHLLCALSDVPYGRAGIQTWYALSDGKRKGDSCGI